MILDLHVKIGTMYATLYAFILNVSSETIFETIILSFIGGVLAATGSFLITYFLRKILPDKNKNKNNA